MMAYPSAIGAFTGAVCSSVPDPEVRDSVGTFYGGFVYLVGIGSGGVSCTGAVVTGSGIVVSLAAIVADGLMLAT